MKKTQIKELFKNIKKTFVSFLSITMFVFLGVAVFEGLGWAGNSQKKTIDDNFTSLNGYDLKGYLPFGISKDDIDQLKEYEEIDEIEGYFSCYEYFNHGDYKYLASVQSLTENINKTQLVEGRLPESPNELAIVGGAFNNSLIRVGDKVTFTHGDGQNNFAIRMLRDYVDMTYSSGDEDKSTENFEETEFTVVGMIYTPQYMSNSRLSYGVSPNGSTQVDFAFFTKYEYFNQNVTGGYFNNIFIRSNKLRNLDSFSDEYKNKVKELSDTINTLVLTYANQYGDLVKEGAINLPEALSDIMALLDYSLYEGSITQEAYDKIVLMIQNSLENSTSIEDIPSLVLLKRSDNAIFVFGELLSDCIINVRYSLGGLFIVISLIICYSTITRLVNDERKSIGTKKALGLTRREITTSYVFYALIALLIGGILGNCLAFLIAPLAANSTSRSFNFSSFSTYYNLPEVAILFASLLVIVVLISLLACNKILEESPTRLLTGESEHNNKIRFFEKFKLWKKSSLLNRTIVNNTLNDKRRVFATVFGILGCCCMLVAALTLKNNVAFGFEKQYSEYFKFDTFIHFDSQDTDSKEQIEDYLDNQELTYLPILRESASYSIDQNEPQGGYIMVYFDANEFSKMVHFDSSSGKDFDGKGIWIQESYSKYYNAKEDSVFEITNGIGLHGESRVEGYYKYYSYMGLVFMDSSTYKDVFKKDAIANTFLVSLNGKDIDEVNTSLKDISGYQSIFDYTGYCKLDLDVFNIVSSVLVGIYVIVSTLLSIFVVLNLLKTFVREKKRELITMMINGYSLRDTYKYIYTDTIVLTIIGLILGVGSGILVGSFAISGFEGASIYLLHTPNIFACLIGAGITILLVMIMSIISIREVKTFKLTDVNNII